MDTEARGKIISPLPGIEPRSAGHPVRSQTLDWATGSHSHSLVYHYKFCRPYTTSTTDTTSLNIAALDKTVTQRNSKRGVDIRMLAMVMRQVVPVRKWHKEQGSALQKGIRTRGPPVCSVGPAYIIVIRYCVTLWWKIVTWCKKRHSVKTLKSKSCYDWQSVSQSWCGAAFGAHDPILITLLALIDLVVVGRPSDERSGLSLVGN
jgi:hypothetical protein